MRVLVTGAAGFIGFHTAYRLLQKGHHVTGLDNINAYYDQRVKRKRLEGLYEYDNFAFIEDDLGSCGEHSKWPYTHVVHLAAQAGVRHSLKHPKDYIDSNIIGFSNVIHRSAEEGVENFVYASSSSVYGGMIPPFSDEEELKPPLSLYAATKQDNERTAKIYDDALGLHTTGLRFFTVYGPWGRPDMFMWIVAKAISKELPIPLFGGAQSRDFTYIDDVVDAIILALEKPQMNKVYNVGYGYDVSISSVILRIAELYGKTVKDLKIDTFPHQKGDLAKTLADIRKIGAELGWKPTVSTDEGVRRFVEWFKKFNL